MGNSEAHRTTDLSDANPLETSTPRSKETVTIGVGAKSEFVKNVTEARSLQNPQKERSPQEVYSVLPKITLEREGKVSTK